MFEHNRAVMLLIDPASGAIQDANPAAAAFYGFSREALCGKVIEELNCLPPGEVKALRRQAADALPGRFVFPHRLANNEVRTVEVYASPIEVGGRPLLVSIIHDITERDQATTALRETEYFLTKSQEVAQLGSYEFIIAEDAWKCTRVLDEILGIDDAYPKTTDSWLELIVPADREGMRRHLLEHVITRHNRFDREYRIIRPRDRQERWVHGRGELDHDGQGRPVRMIGTIQDITERKQAEEKLRLANRHLRMLSECNEALIRGTEENELFHSVCRIAVEIGGYRMAWVGLADHDPNRTVRPVARAGFDDGYLEAVRISWADTERGQGPAGIAIRTGQPCPLQNFADDSRSILWRNEAARRGYAAACALPLKDNERTFGALCLYSSQPGAFDATEIVLITRLADNLAFGVATLRTRLERERAERLRREAEGLYRTIFQTSPDGITLFDLEGRITFVSPRALQVVGLPLAESATGRLMTDFIAPEDHGRVRDAFERVLQGRYLSSSEYIVRRPDGTQFVGEFNAALLRDAEGQPKGVLVIMRDTTGRKRAEEALRISERKLAEIFRASPEFIAVSTFEEGRILEVNDACQSLLGFEREDVIGLTANEIRLWQTPAERERIIGLVKEPGRIRNVEARMRKKSGEIVDVLVSMARVNIEGKECLVTVATDIGERKRAEEARLEMERRLLHAQKLESLGVLAGGIAHDFNNLLMAILGNLDLALMDLSPVSPARSSIEQSATAARRAADLTRQMLAYSGKASFDVRRINLSELVAENAHLFRACISKIVVLNVHLGNGLPVVEADSGQIQQVIMNLITNASEAVGDRPGVIALSTGIQTCDATSLSRSRSQAIPPPGSFAFLDVTDTGCGMDDQTQLRLFDPFFSTKTMGRGLGMSAILGIVGAHHGAIFVDSTVGKGTSIRVLFPAAEPSPAAEERNAVPESRPGHSRDRRARGSVLVVDDEDMVRTVCSQILRRIGWSVTEASNGPEAIERYRKNPADFAVVILDQSMPQMDGMTVFRELRIINPAVKVILSSGYSHDLSSGERLAEEGLAGFIQKPYSLQSLRDELDRMLMHSE